MAETLLLLRHCQRFGDWQGVAVDPKRKTIRPAPLAGATRRAGFFMDGPDGAFGLLECGGWWLFAVNVLYSLPETGFAAQAQGLSGTATLSPMTGPAMSLAYQIDARIPGDTTPFVEDEDFDPGLFLSNLVGAPARCDHMLRHGFSAL